MKKYMIVLILVSSGFIISLIVLEFSLSHFARQHKTWPKGLHQLDKYIGWKGIPNREGYIVKEGILQYVKMNSHGFRDRERTYRKRKDSFRILVLGDSITEGLQVPLERTFPYLLEKKLNSESSKEFEVINLGMSGFGTAQEYLALKHYGLKYHPDLVILAFLDENDVWDNFFDPRVRASIHTPFFELNNGKLVEIPVKVEGVNSNKNETHANTIVTGELQIVKDFLARILPNTYYSVGDEINKTPWLANLLQKLGIKNSKPKLADKSKESESTVYNHNSELYSVGSPEWQSAWRVTKALILRISKELKKNNDRFLLVIIPDDVHFMAHSRSKYAVNTAQFNLDFERSELVLSEFLEKNRINYFRLYPQVKKYASDKGKKLYFDDDLHWNAAGHELAAELIYEKLERDRLVPMEVKKLSARD